MDQSDFTEIVLFLEARHAEEADTIQMRATKRVRDVTAGIAESELGLIDTSEIIDGAAEILKALAQPYASHEDFQQGWVLELMP